MDKETSYQTRLKAIGLSQFQFAAMLGIAPNTVSRQFNGRWEMPTYVSAFLIALEIMTPEQRAVLFHRLNLL